MSFQKVLHESASLGLHIAIMENVPGFPRHQDFREMISSVKEKGLLLTVHGVFDCAKVLPVQRDRWLGTFVSCKIDVDRAKQLMANAISFADRAFQSVACCPTIKDADVAHVHMSEADLQQLTVSSELLTKMSMIEYAPQWLKNRLRGIPHPSASQVMNARIVIDCQQFIGLMAMYGRQHMLADELLRSKGLQTMLFNDGKSTRYISPWEMVACLGYTKSTVLSSDISVSWRMAGNGLSVAHAWLQLHKTHVLLGQMSPFTPSGTPIQQVAAFQQGAIKLSTCTPKINGHFWELVECVAEPSCKRPKLDPASETMVHPTVPPTVTFTVDEEETCSTSALSHAPEFIQAQDPRGVTVIGSQYEGGMVTLQHDQNHWIMFVNTKSSDTVGNVICKALPHAKAYHFRAFLFAKSNVEWNSSIVCKPIQALVFCPVFTAITCREESLKIALNLNIDVTWTARTALAYSAVRLGCNPDALTIATQNLPLKEDDFLMEYQTVEFRLKFKACMPGYVSWAPSTAEVPDSGMKPVPTTMKRWFSRHPARKVVRTICVGHDTTVLALVQQMFPEIHATTTWTAFNNDVEVPNHAKINELSEVQIQWNGFRPLKVTYITAVKHHGQAVDAPALQILHASEGTKRHVRSPFKVKADEISLDKGMTIGEVAASFMTVAQLQVSMICSQGAMVLDPLLKVEDTLDDGVLAFRICPLLGGAKTDTKSRISEMLQSKGVPAEKVEDRVKGLLAKVSVDKLKANLADDAFWTQLKTIASEHKYRLITFDELKAFQAANRKGKSGAPRDAEKSKAKDESFQVDASRIVIDASHFAAGEDKIDLIESTRFGPDQTGICVVNASDAKKWSANGIKSCDPLALLVVGKGCQDHGEVFNLPAYTPNGTPIIVQGCLVQFGDVPITFNLKIPTVVVDQVASTAVEFAIYRKHVTCWDDVAVPLHYIGVHIPELRGSNLLATWSIKSWDQKQVAHVSKADHWHGFFRITDSLLHAVLGRSGVAGIFLNPKTPDRKHDPRFVTISLPSGLLTDVLAKAEACPRALGVAKRGEVYCIRCRREDADQLRASLMPETAYVETASFSEEETLFVLNNVPQINRDELTVALARAGWNANAIKPQGLKRWLVAAKHDPPTCHLGINGLIVVVEKAKRGGAAIQPVTMVAKEFKVDTIRDPHNNLVQVSTTSRIAEFKAHMDDQIAAVVDQRLANAHARIEELQCALQDVRESTEKSHACLSNDMGQMKQEQTFTRQKLQEVEASVSSSGQAIIQQMQNMFANMQSSLEKTVQQSMNGEAEKRQRIEDPGRADPFSTKVS